MPRAARRRAVEGAAEFRLGGADATAEQLKYAANDVLWLHRLRQRLDEMLAREGRTDLAQACFGFIEHRARLDHEGWPDDDIFAY